MHMGAAAAAIGRDSSMTLTIVQLRWWQFAHGLRDFYTELLRHLFVPQKFREYVVRTGPSDRKTYVCDMCVTSDNVSYLVHDILQVFRQCRAEYFRLSKEGVHGADLLSRLEVAYTDFVRDTDEQPDKWQCPKVRF